MNNIREGKGGSGGNLHVGEAVDMPHLDDILRQGRRGRSGGGGKKAIFVNDSNNYNSDDVECHGDRLGDHMP